MEIILGASSKHADINTGQICRACSNMHICVLKAICKENILQCYWAWERADPDHFLVLLCTPGSGKKKNHLNFQPIIHMTGEFFQFLSIQKVSPRAGMKHVGAVSCWALWKPHLFELHAQNGNSLGSTCEQQQQMHLRNSSSSEVHFLTYAKSVLHSPFSNLCLQHVQPLYCIFLPQYLSYRFWDWKG